MTTIFENPPRVRHHRVDLADIAEDAVCHAFRSPGTAQTHSLCGVPREEQPPHGSNLLPHELAETCQTCGLERCPTCLRIARTA